MLIKYKILFLISQNKRLSEIAQELGISQPTVTFHLKSLEEHLNLKLFHNKNKYLCLTEAGKGLLPYISEMLELEGTLLKKASQYLHFETGSITIGSTLAPSISLLPDIISSFHKNYKSLHISLETGSTHTIIQGIIKHHYDLGFISSNAPLPPYLISTHFTFDELVLVYPNYLDATFKNSTSNQILTENNFIHHTENSSTFKSVYNYLKRTGLNLKSTICVNSAPVIKELIKKEIGISILPISLIKSELENQIFNYMHLNAPEFQKEVQLIYHENTYLSPMLKTFIDYALKFKFH